MVGLKLATRVGRLDAPSSPGRRPHDSRPGGAAHRGGVRLARPAREISIGQVVREMESGLGVVECLEMDGGRCVIGPACRLKHLLADATEAFLHTLDAYTLEDVTRQRVQMARLLGIPVAVEAAAV